MLKRKADQFITSYFSKVPKLNIQQNCVRENIQVQNSEVNPEFNSKLSDTNNNFDR